MFFKSPFLTLRKHIELNVYAAHAAVHQSNPLTVRSRSNYMKIAKGGCSGNQVSTCYGFIQMLKKSAILHSWMDWDLIVFDDGAVSTMATLPPSLGVSNHTDTASDFSKRNGLLVVKCEPSLKVECAEDVQFITSTPPFLSQKFVMPSGILEFKHQHEINFFMYLEAKSSSKLSFKRGDQLLAITPLSDRPVNIQCHYDKKHHQYLVEKSFPLSKNNSYVKTKHISERPSDD